MDAPSSLIFKPTSRPPAGGATGWRSSVYVLPLAGLFVPGANHSPMAVRVQGREPEAGVHAVIGIAWVVGLPKHPDGRHLHQLPNLFIGQLRQRAVGVISSAERQGDDLGPELSRMARVAAPVPL